MSLADDLASSAAQSVRRDRPQHPAGWEPGIAWDGTHGTITSRPIAEPTPDWDALLRTWGFDPATVEIVEPVQVRAWDAAIGNGEVRTMWYYRAGVRQRRADAPDVADLIRRVRAVRREAPPRPDQTTRAFHVCMNDWQIGKKGTEATVERVKDGFADAERRLLGLRKERPIETIYLDGIGDLFEGCRDHYAMQTFEVELDNRRQGQVVRELVLAGIDRFRRLGPVIVPAVGGNHGEERTDGKAYTTFADNKDVGAIEAVAEACALNPRAYGNVSFLLPADDLTLTFDAAGTIVGLTHGHSIKGGRGPAYQRIVEWWKGQMYGMRPIGDADLVVTAHLHQFLVHQDGKRTLAIAPTSDAGSQWYAERYGVDSVPSMLTFTTAAGGWDDMRLV